MNQKDRLMEATLRALQEKNSQKLLKETYAYISNNIPLSDDILQDIVDKYNENVRQQFKKLNNETNDNREPGEYDLIEIDPTDYSIIFNADDTVRNFCEFANKFKEETGYLDFWEYFREG